MRIASSLTLPLILILSACSSQPTPKEKNPSVAQQQSSADKAYDELDAEINEIERVVVEPKRKIVKRPVATKSEPTTSKRKIVSRNRTVTTKTTQTKYPLQNGLPVWFFSARYGWKIWRNWYCKTSKTRWTCCPKTRCYQYCKS